jgi:hypothetical protein
MLAALSFASGGGGGGASAEGGDDHGAHPSIFSLGKYLNFFHATVCFCVLIICTIILEYFVHWTEHHIVHKMPAHYLHIFNTVIKELMILGVISFSIFIGEQAFELASKEYYLALEFAHVTIFFAALVFVVQATFLLTLMNGIVMKWDRLAARSLDSLVNEGNDVQSGKTVTSHERSELLEAMEFHIMKHQFIKTHSLSNGFDFVLYLEKCLAVSEIMSLSCVANLTLCIRTCLLSPKIEITNTVDISIKSWSIVCLSLWVNYAFYESARHGTEAFKNNEIIFSFVAGGWTMLSIEVFLLYRSFQSEKHLLEAVGVSNRSSLEELTWAVSNIKYINDRVKAEGSGASGGDAKQTPDPEINALTAGSSSSGGYGGIDDDSTPLNALKKLDIDGGWVLHEELQLVFWFGSPKTFQVSSRQVLQFAKISIPDWSLASLRTQPPDSA